MKINAYDNGLRDNALATKLMDTMDTMTDEFSFVLPRGWRFITKIVTKIEPDSSPCLLLYLDLQADQGGGSWAEAKIQTMERTGLAATQPLKTQTVLNLVRVTSTQETKYRDEILQKTTNWAGTFDTSQFSPEAIHWLVDVKDGPGIAPNFGGLRLSAECRCFLEKNKPSVEKDTIYVAFSGGAAWQDLQFATAALECIIHHLDSLPDESFGFDLKSLAEIPEVHLWLRNYGLYK